MKNVFDNSCKIHRATYYAFIYFILGYTTLFIFLVSFEHVRDATNTHRSG